MKKTLLTGLLAIIGCAVLANLWTPSAEACGGFFCTNVPVDQNAERIIFTQNKDGTVSAYVQIEYTGAAPDFSWILPLPEAIPAQAITIPDDAMEAFRELEAATTPVFIPPELPECAQRQKAEPTAALASAEQSVEVFASGEVGPYGFDVVGSDDPDALVTWLKENGYQVTTDMEPIIDLYVQEGSVFLAMKLRPDQGIQDIEPVKVTYPSEQPMIPLRLTAVAANPDMGVTVWIYADQQATPSNYASMNVKDEEIVFFDWTGRNNYRQLMGEKANQYGGQAFITEYAAPSSELRITHPLLQQLRNQYPYVTRLNTMISPDEMTVDPVFEYNAQLKDVSNIRDLSNMTGLFACEKAEQNTSQSSNAKATQNTPSTPERPDTPSNPENPDNPSIPENPDTDQAKPNEQNQPNFTMFKVSPLTAGIMIGIGATLLVAAAVYIGILVGRRNRPYGLSTNGEEQ